MIPKWLTRSLVIVATGSVGFVLGQSVSGPGGFTELHRGPVIDSPELETVLGLIERPPRAAGSKHVHPGGEFGYVIRGEVTVEAEGAPPRSLYAGDSFYQPPGEWHIVSTEGEDTETVVFRVVKKGQPMVVAVE
jgi:quercetin dioxygenase-like cupin family protein